ncbi:hypothetical protein WJX73_007704 [Symbiochloris irregularis]|uniref:FHA domain-containing protein n=1 Tax=Symbiochloris irregularis TaxID=706552 RepID=A0AAW1P022_9CHLO
MASDAQAEGTEQQQRTAPDLLELQAVAGPRKVWTLRDIGSSNGTFINGNKLEEEGEAVELKNGDTILFGHDSKVRVQIRPVIYDDLTIQQILELECAREEQQIKARVEQLLSESEQQWQATKARLLTAHLADEP